MSGKKHDSNKHRWDMIPFDALVEVAKCYTYGGIKYDEKSLRQANWKKVKPFKERYFAAAMRHISAWRTGEIEDRESGLYHLAHAIFNLMCLLWYDIRGK